MNVKCSIMSNVLVCPSLSFPYRIIREWSAPSLMSSAWITSLTWPPRPTWEEVRTQNTHTHTHTTLGNSWQHTAGKPPCFIKPLLYYITIPARSSQTPWFLNGLKSIWERSVWRFEDIFFFFFYSTAFEFSCKGFDIMESKTQQDPCYLSSWLLKSWRLDEALVD